MIEKADKIQTIRLFKKDDFYKSREGCFFKATDYKISIDLTLLKHDVILMSEITEKHAKQDGFKNLDELCIALKNTYKNINENSKFDVFLFQKCT